MKTIIRHKKRTLSTTLFLVLFAAFFIIHSANAYAYEGHTNPNTAYEIDVNAEYNDFLPDRNTSNYYKFTLNEPGFVSFTFKHPAMEQNSKYWEIKLFDESDAIYSYAITGHSIDSTSANIGLPAGEHIFQISHSGYNFSNEAYIIKVNFTASQNWEQEKNETYITANDISINATYSGTLRASNDQDWYRFTLDTPGYVNIAFNHQTMSDDYSYWRVCLYNDDDKTSSMNIWWQSGLTESSKTCNIGLDSGTYYIQIVPAIYNFAPKYSSVDYSFAVNFLPASNWEKEYNNGFATAEQINLEEVRYGSIFKEGDEDYYTFTLDQPGMVSIKFDHEIIDSTSAFWKVSLISDNDKNHNMGNWSFSGLEGGKSANVSAAAGKYYIKVSRSNHSDKDYNFSVSLVDDPVEAFVKRMYTEVLGRQPDEQGLRNYITALYNGSKKGADVAADFYLSQEVLGKHPSNDEYVQLAYKGLMGRESSAEERVYWVEALDSGVTYHAIVSGFVGSPEFKKLSEDYGITPGAHRVSENRDKNIGITKFVARLYTKALGRGFDVDGLNDWTGNLNNNHTKSNILRVSTNGFFHSQEFLGKNLDNTEFVSVAYRTFLGREPEPEGHAYWINQLQSGMSRDEVLAGFANSPEFANIMAQYGL